MLPVACIASWTCCQLTCYQLHMLPVARFASCTFCQLHVLPVACVVSCTYCQFHVLPVARVASCMCCQLHVLLVACVASCICCELQVLSVACFPAANDANYTCCQLQISQKKSINPKQFKKSLKYRNLSTAENRLQGDPTELE